MYNIERLFDNWIQVVDPLNNITIENYGYETGVIEGTTDNHCVKCTSANYCWFKDEGDKKPKPFQHTPNILYSIAKRLMSGLYHPNCHCEERPITAPSPDEIKLSVRLGKIDWLFKDKTNWVESLGYKTDNEFLNVLYQSIKEAYCSGNYKVIEHNKNGVKANLFLYLAGANEKAGKTYPSKSAFMIFPNGTLKCNTLIGGWYK